MFSSQSNFLQALGWAVFDSLWQMGILWVCYQLITALRARMTPAAKTRLASSLLLTGFAWFLINLVSGITGHVNTGFSASPLFSDASSRFDNWLPLLLPYASMAYLALLFIPLVRFYRNLRYVHHIRYRGLSKPAVDWRLYVKRTAEHLGINRKVTIWLSEHVTSPLTVGYLKPVILLPIAAVTHLNPGQIETILLHELAHICRYDYLINLISRLIHAVLYFNPFVKAFVRIQERERERAADELVLQFQYDKIEYASALLMLGKLQQPATLALPAAGSDQELLGRIEWIVGARRRNPVPYRNVTLATLFLLGVMCLAGLSYPVIKKDSAPAVTPMLADAQINPADVAYASYPVSAPEVDEATAEATMAVHATELPAQLTVSSPMQNGEVAMEALSFGKRLPAVLAELARKGANNEQSPFIPAAFNLNNIHVDVQNHVQLSDEDEAIVRDVVTSSQKVVGNINWTTIEGSIADAMTNVEKEAVKADYEAKLAEKQAEEWRKVEQQMRAAYDQINWQALQTELQTELYKLRLDSIQNVYQNALVTFNQLQRQLESSKLKGIPDTDITLGSILERKRQTAEGLKRLDKLRNRKTVEL
ncbi:M56 family metallopeptidase [Terrimonas ferruginea]|uniref:M56 family metallopeptidase n=1 Tax=Terrimonas ferruginea TaxID=249 RepID=UPI000404CF1A|nr:M56 family metallopeptidase [Terrimonas ferruginea]